MSTDLQTFHCNSFFIIIENVGGCLHDPCSEVIEAGLLQPVRKNYQSNPMPSFDIPGAGFKNF